MHRIFHPLFLLPFLPGLGLSMPAWEASADASDQMPVKPHSCREMIVELQNQLHAANQTAQSLMDQNMELRQDMGKIESENRKLRETINRIRNEAGGGGYHTQGRQGAR